MNEQESQADNAKSWLYALMKNQLSQDQLQWLDEKSNMLDSDFTTKEFYLTFSLTPRFVGKHKLQLTNKDYISANEIRKGYYPKNLTADQAARILFLISIPLESLTLFREVLATLFSTATVNEQITLYSALPLLPNPLELKNICEDGIRTNITSVFDAIALHNPYPAEYLDEGAWNQMVLKAVFMERPLDQIIGLDKRANNKLANMLSDYAHERWAANRYVSPELWRPVGFFLDKTLLDDIKRLFEQGELIDKEAAALACSQSEFTSAKKLLSEFPELQEAINNNEIDWKTVSKKWVSKNV